MICPICGVHRAIVQQITTHQGKTNQFARDVIGQRLECGHDVYGQEAAEFQKEIAKINSDYSVKALALERQRADDIAKAHIAVRAKVSGGKK